MPATPIHLTGTLGKDPELRDVGSSQVASFSVAVSERKKEGDQWVDSPPTWFNCSAWRDLATNVVASLHKGDRVLLSGTIGERTWTDREGNEKKSMEVTVDEIGPALRFATASVQRAGGGGRGGQRPPAGNGDMTGRSGPQGRPTAQPQQDTWSGGYNSEVPF